MYWIVLGCTEKVNSLESSHKINVIWILIQSHKANILATLKDDLDSIFNLLPTT